MRLLCPLHAALGLRFVFTAGASRHVERSHQSSAGQSDGESRSKLVPSLSPKSDWHFFGHDYPDDLKPKAPLEAGFDHPYPVVQESAAFDKDYVKDENADHGEWKAQMEYDRLRTRTEQLKAAESRMRRKKEELERKLQEERQAKKQLDEETKGLAEKKREAKEAHTAAEEAAREKHEREVEHAGAEDRESLQGVVNASGDVEKEMQDLEGCKKKLAEAQAKLKELQDEVKAAEQKEASAREEEAKAEQQASALQSQEKEARGDLQEAQESHERALKSYKVEKEDLESMEARLHKAEAQVRAFRRDVDQGGGVYRTEHAKGAAPGSTATGLGLLLSLALVLSDAAHVPLNPHLH